MSQSIGVQVRVWDISVGWHKFAPHVFPIQPVQVQAGGGMKEVDVWRICSEKESMMLSSCPLKAPNTERLRTGPPTSKAMHTNSTIMIYSIIT